MKEIKREHPAMPCCTICGAILIGPYEIHMKQCVNTCRGIKPKQNWSLGKEITLEELYEVITNAMADTYDEDGYLNSISYRQLTTELLTDLNKLGYKIVKE